MYMYIQYKPSSFDRPPKISDPFKTNERMENFYR